MRFALPISIICLLSLCLSPDVYSGWDKITTSAKQTLYGLNVLDAQHACAAGWTTLNDAAIYLTSDGGTNWKKQPVSNAYLFGTKMLDANTIIVSGYSGYCSCAMLYYTLNGGEVWDSLYFDASTPAYSFGFYTYVTLDSKTALTSGYGGVIAKTTSGGEGWYSTQTNNGTDVFRVLTVADSKTLYAASGDNGNFLIIDAIYRSTDAGETWTMLNGHEQKYSIGALSFTNAATGLLFGNAEGKEAILKTNDSGATWKTVWSSAKNSVIQSGAMLNDKIGYAVGNAGRVLRTSDGGNTWVEENSSISSDLLAVSVVDEQTAFAVGASGVILKRKEGDSPADVQENPILRHLLEASVNPLPASESMHIRLYSAIEQHCSIVVYDATGNKVQQTESELAAGANSISLNTASFSQGVYTILLKTPTSISTVVCPLVK